MNTSPLNIWFKESPLAALVLPGLFVLGCILYYGGIWFFRMRVGGRRMAAVAKEFGGTYRPDYNQTATKALPQFEGTQLRLARGAYNVVKAEWSLHDRPCTVWMGDAGNQWNSDALVQAVGGEIFASFIAVQCPFPKIHRAVILDRGLRSDEHFERVGYAVDLWESIQTYSEREGLLHMKLDLPDLDDIYDFRVDSPYAFHAMFNRRSINMLDARPGHIWIKDDIIMLECGDRVWSASEFIARAQWLRDFIEAWDDAANPDAHDEELIKPRSLF